MANRILGEAKKAKNDEFYTQYADIQKEINAYLELDADVFRDKTVLLPCDDPEWSNFTLFFAQNFTKFGLKKLISTSYAAESKNFKHVWQPSLFNTVIDWADGVFAGVEDEMCGLEWGRLYETYHATPYDPQQVWARVRALYADEFVKNRRGAFEYILGGERDTKLLEVRCFEPKETKVVYERQTAEARAVGKSHCPLCALGQYKDG